MKLLVTGGAGYIGGFVTRMLRRQDHEVTVVDDLSSGRQAAAGDASLVPLDFGDRPAVGRLMREHEIEAVLHFAGLKSVAQSWDEPGRYLDVNVARTISLANAMADAGVNLLVYSSSCAIYGDATSPPFDESAPAAPLNPYARTKWLAEQALECAAEDGALRYVALRYFNAAGAEFDGSAGEELAGAVNLVPVVMKAALGMVPAVEIYGTDYPTHDGTAVRDYVHVLDLAEAHVRSIEYLCSGSRSIRLNVGTGTGTSVRQIVAETERVTGRPIAVVESDRRAGDPAAVWASVELADRTLGWRSRYGVDDIVRSAWAWHSSHPHGFD
jgi:UDP-glucose 4-epimerase